MFNLKLIWEFHSPQPSSTLNLENVVCCFLFSSPLYTSMLSLHDPFRGSLEFMKSRGVCLYVLSSESSP